MRAHLPGVAIAAVLLASAAEGEPHRMTPVDNYEDFIAAKAAASKCLHTSPQHDAIYAAKFKRVTAYTESVILTQNPRLSRPQVRSKMAAAATKIQEKVLAEVKAKSCSGARILPLLDFYARQSVVRKSPLAAMAPLR
jgi:hypothetical protein